MTYIATSRGFPKTDDKAPAGSRFPSAYTILFALIVIMAALTWVIPALQYPQVANEALGKDVPVPGTYETGRRRAARAARRPSRAHRRFLRSGLLHGERHRRVALRPRHRRLPRRRHGDRRHQ